MAKATCRTWWARTTRLPVPQVPRLQFRHRQRCLQVHLHRVAQRKVALLGTCPRLVEIPPLVLTAGDSRDRTRCGQEAASRRATPAPQWPQAPTVGELDQSRTPTPVGELAAVQAGQAATGAAWSMIALNEGKAHQRFGSPSLAESSPHDCHSASILRSAPRLLPAASPWEEAFERLLAWANLVLWFLWGQMHITWHPPWLQVVQRIRIILMGIAVAVAREGTCDLVDGDEKDLRTGTLLPSKLGVKLLQRLDPSEGLAL
mmetsp:Transcript_806/g.1526  ORF Transcript_806/g.1526 Transcript_806/m.1526 type:complete len:260 (+) Transcript_806:1746-2525(+)